MIYITTSTKENSYFLWLDDNIYNNIINHLYLFEIDLIFDRTLHETIDKFSMAQQKIMNTFIKSR